MNEEEENTEMNILGMSSNVMFVIGYFLFFRVLWFWIMWAIIINTLWVIHNRSQQRTTKEGMK